MAKTRKYQKNQRRNRRGGKKTRQQRRQRNTRNRRTRNRRGGLGETLAGMMASPGLSLGSSGPRKPRQGQRQGSGASLASSIRKRAASVMPRIRRKKPAQSVQARQSVQAATSTQSGKVGQSAGRKKTRRNRRNRRQRGGGSCVASNASSL